MIDLLTFTKLINNMKEQYELENNACKYIIPETFDKAWQTIDILLNQLFTEEVIDYVIWEYLQGNKSPITIDGKEYKTDTIEQLYEVVTLLNVPVSNKEEKEKETVEYLKKEFGYENND